MSVSGYSVQHDPEVQAYNEMRKAYLAAEKERKQQEKAAKREDKLLQEALKKDHRLKTQTDNHSRSLASRIFRKREKEPDQWMLFDGVEEKVLNDESDVEDVSLKDALKC